ncbi:NOSIP [Cordylochernes scorpioides]|uniref:Nitric oxide synthase-interacting protein homolog n=1 Tax=Cordylochernes scorpioides TaxID=51811 RepID=A0ABY6K2U7_9ARAC|nr:NOSIP [Cordylochernes scorpioides]
MTRHARNCTAGAVYTYHEKQKDTKAGGYGTIKKRLGKDSIQDFDCCSLTLQPCRDPVITPEGYLFDKEAILEFIIHQKVKNAQLMKEYEKQKKKEKEELAEIAAAEQRTKAELFAKNQRITSASSSSTSESTQVVQKSTAPGSSISNMAGPSAGKLPSFWVPSLTPQSKESKMEKPSKVVRCPMSGKPLKAKDLLPVKFTEIKDPDDKKSLITRENRYKCAVTHDALGNSVPCAVLKPNGVVVTMECVEKIIKKDMLDPFSGQKLKESDIIPMQRGGTGYAATNNALDAKVERAVIQA